MSTRRLRLVDDARSGVRRIVCRHLRWVEDNPVVAGLLLSAPQDLLRQAGSAPALDANRKFFTELAQWLRELGWVESRALSVVMALRIGPAQEYGRQWLALDDRPRLEIAGDQLAEGAWASLKPMGARSVPVTGSAFGDGALDRDGVVRGAVAVRRSATGDARVLAEAVVWDVIAVARSACEAVRWSRRRPRPIAQRHARE